MADDNDDKKKPKITAHVIKLDENIGENLANLLREIGVGAMPGGPGMEEEMQKQGLTLEKMYSIQEEGFQKLFRRLLPIIKEELGEMGSDKLGFFKYAYKGSGIGASLYLLASWVKHKTQEESHVPDLEWDRQTRRLADAKKLEELFPEMNPDGSLKSDTVIPKPNVKPSNTHLN